MQVTVKLSSREGAAHISGILAGFTLLAKRGKLTLRVQDVRQGNPLAREALLETEIDGRTVVFDLMDGYFYISPAAYATRAQWQHWIAAALAFNPLAKATRKKAARGDGAPPRSLKESTPRASSLRKTAKTPSNTKTTPRPPARKHSVFDDDA